MSDFGHMKNDMPKFGHIKNYIIRHIKKHRNRDQTRKTVLFRPIQCLFDGMEGNLLFNMSIGDPERWGFSLAVGTHDRALTVTGVLSGKTSRRSM